MDVKDVLTKAIECDQAGRILEALNLYQDGIGMLTNLVTVESDQTKKKVFNNRIRDYIERAEQIKSRVKHHVMQGAMVTNVLIEDDTEGYNYQMLFGQYLTADVQEVLLEEPYLVEKYQFQNLIQFLELVVKNCLKLTYIHLVTKSDQKAPDNQRNILEQIKSDMVKRNITLVIEFEDALHDRRIVLSNGFIIKLGRGLHFFKATNPLYSLGLCDYYFRKCMKTEVLIYRTKNFVA